jgi:hypothetical protein
VRLERAGEPLGHRPVYAAVEVNRYVEPRRARRGQPLGRLLHSRLRVQVMQLSRGVHLHRGQAGLPRRSGRRRHLRRPVAAGPAIDPHAVARAAAEQLPRGHAQRAALDVPQRLLDPRERAAQHRSAAVEAAAPHDLEVVLDPERVAADELLAELASRRAMVSARPSTIGSPQPATPSSVESLRNSQRGGTANSSSAVMRISGSGRCAYARPGSPSARGAPAPGARPRTRRRPSRSPRRGSPRWRRRDPCRSGPARGSR